MSCQEEKQCNRCSGRDNSGGGLIDGTKRLLLLANMQ